MGIVRVVDKSKKLTLNLYTSNDLSTLNLYTYDIKSLHLESLKPADSAAFGGTKTPIKTL